MWRWRAGCMAFVLAEAERGGGCGGVPSGAGRRSGSGTSGGAGGVVAAVSRRIQARASQRGFLRRGAALRAALCLEEMLDVRIEFRASRPSWGHVLKLIRGQNLETL